MTDDIFINLAFEDSLHEAVLRKIFSQLRRPLVVGNCFSREGFGYLKRNIRGFNNAAKGTPFLVLTDLDQVECAPILIKNWLPFPKHPNLLFRVAVREVEAWLLAHREAIFRYLGIAKDKIPINTDVISDPKQVLINLARRSKYRAIREAIVPKAESTAQQGPDYNGKLITYVNKYWDCMIAAHHSPSLNRTIITLNSFDPQQSPSSCKLSML